MNDILLLEQRLAAALLRISNAAETLSITKIWGAEAPVLDPKTEANEALEAMVPSADFYEIQAELTDAREKFTEQASQIVELTQALEADRTPQVQGSSGTDRYNYYLVEEVSELEAKLSQVAQSNAQLREANQNLRDANAKGVGDSGLINFGLQAEINSLTAERAADAAQMQLLITALTNAAEEPQDA